LLWRLFSRRRRVDSGLIVNSRASQWKRHQPGSSGRLAGHEGVVRMAQGLWMARMLETVGLLVIARKANSKKAAAAR
jgi:hypothetical protein